VQPPDTLDVSVVVPTIGRAELLRTCLASVVACAPRAAEIVVADQSDGAEVEPLVQGLAADGVRRAPCSGTGTPATTNCGIRAARHPIVLVTHDDCTVQRDWVLQAHRLLRESPDLIVTGKVIGDGDPGTVPSTKEDPEPHDFTGEHTCGALYPNNMGFHREPVLDFGAFDERFVFAAEDNDLSYRWLRAGRRLRYEPALVVHHRDWRAPTELRTLYRRYWYWQGIFYAKHLRGRDLSVLRFLAHDAYALARYAAARALRRGSEVPDPRSGLARGLPSGLATGLRREW